MLPRNSVSSPGMSMAPSRAKVTWSRSSTSSLKPCSAPSGNAISRTGRSRLDNHDAAFTRCDRCSRLIVMSLRFRMPRTVGIRPTAVYGLITPSPFHLRQPAQRLLDLRRRVLVILKAAREERLVRAEVEVTVAGEVEQDGLAATGLLALHGLVHDHADGMRGLGRRDDALGPGELEGRLERGELRDGHRLDVLLVVELADERRHAVIAQAAGVQRRRD